VLLDYARLDTHYLLPLRDRLAGELAAAGRTAEAREECDRMTDAVDVSSSADGQAPFWRVSHARRLTGSQAAVLRAVQLARRRARRRDCPPFKVMSDASLWRSPRPRRAAGEPSRRRSTQQRQGALRRGPADGRASRPGCTATAADGGADEAAQARFQRLREWRRHAAAALGVESDVILPKEMAWEIARANPADLMELHPLMNPLETRFAAHGADILFALHNGLPAAGRPQ
jgi:ribonuclease D